MQKVAEYLKKAEQCLAMAAVARDENIKNELEEMAKHWILLAAELQKDRE